LLDYVSTVIRQSFKALPLLLFKIVLINVDGAKFESAKIEKLIMPVTEGKAADKE